MFNLKEYRQLPSTLDDTTVIKFSDKKYKNSRLFDEEFKVRRLNGLQLFDYQAFKPEQFKEQVIFVLSNCLVDAESNKPIGKDWAAAFVLNDFDATIYLYENIIKYTNDMITVEDEVVEEEIKNSEETGSQSSITDTANGSDSTQE